MGQEEGIGRRAILGWYAAVAVLCTLVPAVGYRLDAVRITAPLLYDDDALLILPMVQSTLENGTHWRTPRLGAPTGQEMHDFPVVDHLHFFLIRLLGVMIPNAVVVFNVYFLLTYPLAGVLAMAAVRHLGGGVWAAATVGILYACTPYHQYRGQNHYFLSAYFLVPTVCVLIIWLTQGRSPFFPPGRRFSLRTPDAVVGTVIALLTACAGAYYAFFACGLLCGAALYGAVAGRNWRPLASGGLLIGMIFLAGVVNHLPTFLYQAEFGRHTAPTERFSEEAERYGLKLAQLLLPIDDHRIRVLSDVKATYNTYDRPVQSFTERYSLGIVGAVGLVGLLARLILPVRRTSPDAELSALAGISILIGTVGGFGAVFNHLVTPQVRCYNRIVVYLAFFCLFAVAGWIERFVKTRPRTSPGIWCAVVLIGLTDQIPYDWAGPSTVERIEKHQHRFATDAAFFAATETILNPLGDSPNRLVFQLPYVRWPESSPTRDLAAYEHSRGYIHTRTVGWSFGCMKGRLTDEWYRRTAVLPVEAMLEKVVAGGFDGLFLDKRGYPPAKAEQLVRQIAQVLGTVRRVDHPDGQQVFFDLQSHRTWLMNHYGPGWEAVVAAERKPVGIEWLHGFTSFKEPGYEWQHRWCGPDGVAVFVNSTDSDRTFVTHFHLRTNAKEPVTIRIRGGDLWTEDVTVTDTSPIVSRTFTVPPGRHTVRFHCPLPPSYQPADTRRLVFFIAGLRLE